MSSPLLTIALDRYFCLYFFDSSISFISLCYTLYTGATNKPQELDDAVLRRLVSFIFTHFNFIPCSNPMHKIPKIDHINLIYCLQLSLYFMCWRQPIQICAMCVYQLYTRKISQGST